MTLNQPTSFHDPGLYNWCVTSNDAVPKHYKPSSDDSDSSSVVVRRVYGSSDGSAGSAVAPVPAYLHDDPYLPPTSSLSPAPGPSRPLQYTIAPEHPPHHLGYSYPSSYPDSIAASAHRLRPTPTSLRPEYDYESSPEQDQPYLPPGYQQPRPLYLTHPYLRPSVHVDQNIYDVPPLLPPIPPMRDLTESPSLSSSSYESQVAPPPAQSLSRRARPRGALSSSPTSIGGGGGGPTSAHHQPYQNHQHQPHHQQQQQQQQQPRSRKWLETERYLRTQIGISQGTPVNLFALPDPPPGQKPQQPLPILVKLAIHGSEKGKLTLQEIYQALERRFDWFQRRSDQAWKNSIRHNLSLNQVFRSSERPITEPGKGRYWELDISKGEGYKRERRRNKKNTAPYNSKRDLPGGVGNVPMHLDLSEEYDEADLSEENTPPAEAVADIALSAAAADPSANRVGGRPLRNRGLGTSRSAPYPTNTSPSSATSTPGAGLGPSGVRVAQSTSAMGGLTLSPVTPTGTPGNISQYAREPGPPHLQAGGGGNGGFAPPRFGQSSLPVPTFGMVGQHLHPMSYSMGSGGALTSSGMAVDAGSPHDQQEEHGSRTRDHHSPDSLSSVSSSLSSNGSHLNG